MSWRDRLANLFHSRKLDAEIDEELQFHLEARVQENLAAGMGPGEARFDAARRFGNLGVARENSRDANIFVWLESAARDVRHAARGMRKSPGFTAVAVVSLALGIGANTAIFSLVNTVMLRLLPVDRPEELDQLITSDGRSESQIFSYPMFRELRRRNHVFSGMFARGVAPVSLVAAGGVERGVIEIVSGNYFEVLGIRPLLGRLFTDADDRSPMAHPFAVVSYRYWRDRLSGNPAVAGTTIRIDNRPFTLIGVAPPTFLGVEVGTVSDAWVPMMMQPAVFGPGRPAFEETGWEWLRILGRRAPGVSEARAQADIEVIGRQIQSQERTARPAAIHLKPAGTGLSRLRSSFENPLYVLMAVVAVVLLIACANIANLLLARSTARQREIAVRVAIGAGRGRLIRQLLTESTLLALLGGVLGMLAAWWGVRVLTTFLPSERMPLTLHVETDGRVLIFGMGVSLLTGILFGLAPALQATRTDLAGNLKTDGAPASTAWRRLDLRRVLIVAQVAMSLLLVVGAGLFLETFRNAVAIHTGLNTESVLMAMVNPALNGYTPQQIGNFYRQLHARLQNIPGILAVGESEAPLLGGDYNQIALTVPGTTLPDGKRSILMNKIDGAFFAAAGITILRGRGFAPQDMAESPPTAIITESAASYFFGTGEPIGRKVGLGGQENVEIVGIVSDSKYRSVREDTPRIAYRSFQQDRIPSRERTIYLRTLGNPVSYMTALRSAIRELDANLPVYNVKTFAEQKADSLVRERLIATLSGFFGGLALLLAAIGLYGVMAYSVSRRTREIGIRMSLGAGRAAVIWMVLRGALGLAVAGIAIGVPLSRWLAVLVRTQLFGVEAGDPCTLVTATLVLAGVAVLAGAIPAWKASRVDPMEALRFQ